MKVNKNIYLNIGLMKTGTTWLFGILKNQKSIHFTPEKEIHFLEMMSDPNFRNFDKKYEQFLKFSRRLKNNTSLNDIQKIRKLKWYMHYLKTDISFDWFDNLFPQNFDGYNCDFSNLSWKASKILWDQIFERYSKVKVSIIFRDPLERIWSHAKFHFRILNGKDFDLKDNDGIDFIKKYDFIEHSSYDLVLNHIENTIGLENLLILFQEDLLIKPLESIKSIESYLETSFDHERIEGIDEKVNQTAFIDMPDWVKNEFGHIKEKSLEAFEKRSINYPELWKE